MAAAADAAIIGYAQLNGLSIVTLDADFRAIIAAAGTAGPSVIRLRVEGLRAREAAALICRVVERIGGRLQSGIFVTATMDTIRFARYRLGDSVGLGLLLAGEGGGLVGTKGVRPSGGARVSCPRTDWEKWTSPSVRGMPL